MKDKQFLALYNYVGFGLFFTVLNSILLFLIVIKLFTL